jgi:hypothetical protein
MFDPGEFAREAVFVMPRHLQPLPPLAEFQSLPTGDIRRTCPDLRITRLIRPLPDLPFADIAQAGPRAVTLPSVFPVLLRDPVLGTTGG